LLEKDVVDTERKFRVDVLYEKTNDIIYSHDLE